MRSVLLTEPDDFSAWRDAARALVLAGVPPDEVTWHEGGAGDLFARADPLPAAAGSLTVPAGFIALAESVVCHSDPERFALLYSLLWRLQGQKTLLSDSADPLVRRVEVLAKAVRRDIHKMRAFVRFRELDGVYVAWFEPEHHIVRANAGFFVRRYGGMRWSIMTPEVSIHWDGAALRESRGAKAADAPTEDAIEAIWTAYYASIFNPARVKIDAMTKEMPKKYWKNMPETALIPALIAGARARETAMIEREMPAGGRETGLAALREEAAACKRCPLWQPATQTVFGEGPAAAAIMFVGEQPGDQEDLAGRPFVGPAGQLFDRAMAAAGIDRTQAYMTNAVKHFKYEPRGKRRIHATPNAGEIEACRWWVDRERAAVKPKLVVALGATAARSVFGKAMAVGKSRGVARQLPDGSEAWVTIHPSYLLRLNDPAAADVEYARFVEELVTIKGRLDALIEG